MLLGEYHKGVEVNTDAISIDEEYFKECNISIYGGYNQYYKRLYYCHKQVFLLYCSNMQGTSNLSVNAGLKLNATCGYDYNYFSTVFQSYSNWLSMVYIRFGEWDKILQLKNDSNTLYEVTLWHYARSFAFASMKRCDSAKTEYESFSYYALLNDSYRDTYIFFTNYGTMFDIANATVLARYNSHCNYDMDESIFYWNKSVTIQDNFNYFEPPLWPINLKSCYGQILVDTGNYSDAITIYNQDLEKHPENGWSLFGLLNALKLSNGNQNEINIIQKQFDNAWKYSDITLNVSCF